MCLGSQKYRGFIIYRNENDNFHTMFCSIFNPKKEVHVHTEKESTAKKIVNCYYARNKAKYGRNIRNKALSLDGIKVFF